MLFHAPLASSFTIREAEEPVQRQALHAVLQLRQPDLALDLGQSPKLWV